MVLNDSSDAQARREQYAGFGSLASSAPVVRQCDTATSDVYFHGGLLGDAMANFTTLMTNGTGECK